MCTLTFFVFLFSVAKMPGHHPLHKAPEKGLKSLLPYLQATLKRDLTQYEQDLLSYPRLCNVCLDGNQVKCSLVFRIIEPFPQIREERLMFDRRSILGSHIIVRSILKYI